MKGIKVIVLVMALMLAGATKIYAQEDVDLNSALDKMTQASLIGNSQELMKYTSPRLIKALGGEKNALKLFKETLVSIKDGNGVIIDTVINYNKLKLLKQGTIHYKFIPQLLVISIPDKEKKMIGITNLLAIKENSTSGWKFMDINNFDEAKINYLLPEFKNKSSFPKKLTERPLVIPKEEVQSTVQYLLNELDEVMKKAE